MSYTVTASDVSISNLHENLEDAGLAISGIEYHAEEVENNLTILGTFTSGEETTIDSVIAELSSNLAYNNIKDKMAKQLKESYDIGIVYAADFFSLAVENKLNYIYYEDWTIFPIAFHTKKTIKTFQSTYELNKFISTIKFTDAKFLTNYNEKIFKIENSTDIGEIEDLSFYSKVIERGSDVTLKINSSIENGLYTWKENDEIILGEIDSQYIFNRSKQGIYIITCNITTDNNTQYGVPIEYSFIIKNYRNIG